jgi:DNA-directed RNA polymerase sigma subunit (sigma70/sigma32)
MRARRQLAQKLNREPTQEELAKESGFPEKRVQELLDLVEDPVSLETPVGDGESMYADLIEDVHSDRPDETTSKKLRSTELAQALLQLLALGRAGRIVPDRLVLRLRRQRDCVARHRPRF